MFNRLASQSNPGINPEIDPKKDPEKDIAPRHRNQKGAFPGASPFDSLNHPFGITRNLLGTRPISGFPLVLIKSPLLAHLAGH